MKTIILLRHAEAEGTKTADFERVLTPRGEKMAAHIGHKLMQKGMWPDYVVCSAAARTRMTAKNIMDVWRDHISPSVDYNRSLYGADEHEILATINLQNSEHTCTMIIGHNPAIHHAVLLLAKNKELTKNVNLLSAFPPASCVIMQTELLDWNELQKQTLLIADQFNAENIF